MKKVIPEKNTHYPVSTRYFYLSQAGKIISDARICERGSLNLMQAGGDDAIIRPRKSKSSPLGVKMLVKFI